MSWIKRSNGSHNVLSKEEVDAVMVEAERAGVSIVKPAQIPSGCNAYLMKHFVRQTAIFAGGVHSEKHDTLFPALSDERAYRHYIRSLHGQALVHNCLRSADF